MAMAAITPAFFLYSESIFSIGPELGKCQQPRVSCYCVCAVLFFFLLVITEQRMRWLDGIIHSMT